MRKGYKIYENERIMSPGNGLRQYNYLFTCITLLSGT